MILRALVLSAAAVAASGCGAFYWVGVRLLYDPATLPAAQILRDTPYDPSAPEDAKRQLDLFLPASPEFATVVFVHGGGWTAGDRGDRVGGADVYGNIGRFLASNGFGAAVISYRLVPTVTWQAQAADVARAVTWVQRHIPSYGGRANAVYLMGHSAGAQIAARVAVEPRWIEAEGGRRQVRGLIAASGAGYDMADEETYALGSDPRYYGERFGEPGTSTEWRRTASPLFTIDRSAPQALVLFAEGDSKPLQRQSRLLHERLVASGVPSRLVVVAGSSHERMVLELSSPHKTAGPAILEFLRSSKSALIP